MFDFKKDKQPKIKDESLAQDDTLSALDEIQADNKDENKNESDTQTPADKVEEKIDVSNVNVHAMPDKFLGTSAKIKSTSPTGAHKHKVSGLKKNILVGSIIGVAVLALLSLAGWFLIKSLEKPQVVQQPVVIPEFTQDDEQPEPESIPEPEPVAECSPNDCELCEWQECLDLEEYCHLEDLCLSDETQLSCPNYACFSGPKPVSEEIIPEPQPGPILLGRDSDNDLLTDVEEGIYGTNPMLADTDADGYADGDELLNMYDPNLANSATLAESNLVKVYSNPEYGFSINYPANWQASTLDELGQEVIFTSNTGEFIEVIIQDNYAGFYTAREWYLSQFSAVNELDLEEVIIGNWAGLKSPDKLNVYLVNNNYIYTISYNIGIKNELSYQATFNMMQNSFRLFENPLE